MKKMFLLLVLGLFTAPMTVHADNKTNSDAGYRTAEEILAAAHNDHPTQCASEIFLNALEDHSSEISEEDDENKVRLWAQNTMSEPSVLEQVLHCPELSDKNVNDDTTIHFSPIVFEFPGSDRTITISYSTQPKVLKQKLILATKKSLPNGDPNPKLMDPNDPAIYINTDPAWYGIMVVQHDSLKDFVGPGKNNTLSLKYLVDNIDDIYPIGYGCTSRSAWANDDDTINQVVRTLVDLKDDNNDYYVAGDINLEWVGYAEIAADIIITVATVGVGEAAMIGARMARIAKNSKQLIKNLRNLSKLDDVRKYAKKAKEISDATENVTKLKKSIKNAKKYQRAMKKAEKLKSAGKDASKYEKKAQKLLKDSKQMHPDMTPAELTNPDLLKAERKTVKKEIKDLKKEAKEMEKNSDNVKQFKESSETFSELNKYYKELHAGFRKRPQTGNLVTRNLKKMNNIRKTIKAANKGSKLLNKSGKLARAGMSTRSEKFGNWLFNTTLKHSARLARVERDTGLLYGAVSFLADSYDFTSSSNNEYTNGIDFKPFCLLSADDIPGQENVVNYGMWLMWEGNSTMPEDDDAAYLQAMDFASKFFHQLDEFQDAKLNEWNISAETEAPEEKLAKMFFLCNVDIYVVRPIIRIDESDSENTTGELFYLFMNEIPWSTAAQFNEAVPNVEDWERTQRQLEKEDPKYKYHKPEDENQKSDSEQQQNNGIESNSTGATETSNSNTENNTEPEESSANVESSNNTEQSNENDVSNPDTPE